MIYSVALCFGDSITYGSRDCYGRGYPPELAKLLTEDNKTEWVCINEGITRETTSDLNRRAYQTISKYPEAKFMCLMIGTNDAKGPTPDNIFMDNYNAFDYR